MFKKLSIPKLLFKKKSFGFTMPELLVIAFIIAILALVIWLWGEPARARARDSQRIAEVNSLRNALQLYQMENGHYPISESEAEEEGWCSLEGGDLRPCLTVATELVPYLPKVPKDPLFPKTIEPTTEYPDGKFFSYQYASISSGEGYRLYCDLETREPYEVYSYLGKDLAYISPIPPPPGLPPEEKYWLKVYNKPSSEEKYPNILNGISSDTYLLTGYSKGNLLVSELLESSGKIKWRRIFKPGGSNKFSGIVNSQKISNTEGYIIGGQLETGQNKKLIIVRLYPNGEEKCNKVYKSLLLPYGAYDCNLFSSIMTTSDGGAIVVGSKEKTCGGGDWDILVMKVDKDGEIGPGKGWDKMYGGTGPEGGETERSVFVQPVNGGTDGYIIAAPTKSYTNGGWDILVMRISSNGEDIKWAKHYGGEKDEQVSSLQKTSSGDCLITGTTESYGSGYKDILIFKVDPDDGTPSGAKTFGGGDLDYTVRQGQEDSEGNILVVGEVSNAEGSAFLMKINPNGETIEWANLLDNNAFTGSESLSYIKEESDGYMLGGRTSSWIRQGQAEADEDHFLLKIPSLDGYISDCPYLQRFPLTLTASPSLTGDSATLGKRSANLTIDTLEFSYSDQSEPPDTTICPTE